MRYRSRRHPENGVTYTISLDGQTLLAQCPDGTTRQYGREVWDEADLERIED